MSAFKGTKGEWTITGELSHKYIIDDCRVPICLMSRQSSLESEVDSMQKANALLISHAPELLEFVINFVEVCESGMPHDKDMKDSAKDLIRKCTEV